MVESSSEIEVFRYSTLGRWRKIYIWYLALIASITTLAGLALVIDSIGSKPLSLSATLFGLVVVIDLVLYLSITGIIQRRVWSLYLIGVLLCLTPMHTLFHFLAGMANSKELANHKQDEVTPSWIESTVEEQQ